MDRPSVGRIVHYVSEGSPVLPDGTQKYESTCRAAVIAEVYPGDQTVSLVVLNPKGVFFHESSYSDTHEGGTWHWPERT